MSNDTREALAAKCRACADNLNELNLANYTEDEVRALNDWAVEAAGLVELAAAALTEQPAVPEHVRRICVPTETMEQEFQTHYRRGYEAGRRASVAVSGGSGIGASEAVELLTWCYTKLHYRSFDNMDDALMLDRIKLLMEHGV